MTKKAILITFITSTVIVVVALFLGYFLITNQPSADTFYANVPAKPSWAPKEVPATPNAPRLAGDISDDGIINAMDINAAIIHWQEKNIDYNLVDIDDSGKIDRADIAQAIKYFWCYELRSDKDCPYLSEI